MNKEIWKSITGYYGFYEVSNLGNVKSLGRIITRKNGIKTTIKERILKKGLGDTGYEHVVLVNSKKKPKTFRVHKLVTMAFLYHVPNGYVLVVDHINNIKTDNRVENLQLISQRENSSKNRVGGTSQYVGVSWSKNSNSWQSSIYFQGKNVHLGYYKTEEEASKVYQEYKKCKYKY